MKGILVFNQLNDIIYLYCDEEFKEHTNKQAVKAGLIQEDEVSSGVDPNVAMQLFAPLVASQRSMLVHIKNPYHTIKCQNGFTFVFEQFHDQIEIAINGDGSESEDFMHRKLLVLQRVISFLFGPVHEEIRPSRLNERNARWRLLSNILDTWCQLYQEEQSFLVEAVERLHLNQMLNAKCIDLLERSISGMKAAGEKNITHAMLIVNAKLLALFSNHKASELQAADIMLIILLMKAKFPSHQRLEDLFSVSYSNIKVERSGPLDIRAGDTDKYDSASEGKEDSEEVEYFSTPSTPGGSPNLADEFKTPIEKDSDMPLSATYLTHKDREALINNDHNETSLDQKGKIWFTNSTATAVSSVSDKDEEPRDSYQRMTALLSTPVCPHTPHTLHCVEVIPGTIMVLVSEMNRGRQAGSMFQVLAVLRSLLNQSPRDSRSGRQTVEVIESNLRKVQDVVRKLKGATPMEKCMVDILAKWDMAKKNRLVEFVDRNRTGDIPPRLESAMSHMYDRLKYLFRLLYLIPWRMPPEVQQSLRYGIHNCQQLLQRELWDYKDYLAVKAQRNIAITTYVEEFPGLVHFVYVDRVSHQMVAPSINVTEEMDSDDVDMQLKNKVRIKMWEMFPDIQHRVQEGFLSQSIKEGDLLFSYFLWYEDASGNPVTPQQPYRGTSENILAGVLAGNFYRSVMRQSVPSLSQRHLYCYELLTVHLALVPTSVVLKHSRKLAHKLFELTSEANAHISLL